MARRHRRPPADYERLLSPFDTRCPLRSGPAPVAYHSHRTVATLDGLGRLTLVVRRCRDTTGPLHHQPYRPEEGGAIALPHGEFGLDLIALVGPLRFAQHRTVPEVHAARRERGLLIAQRSVTNLVQRYEELVSLHLTDPTRLRARLATQGQVILAIDGLQPDVGHEVLWVIRDCVSGAILVARSLLSGREAELAPLLREVAAAVAVPVRGVISDGQVSLRNAVASALPGVPHHNCVPSITCRRQRCRFTRPTAMPRRDSRSRCAGCGRSSGRGQSGMTRRRRCAATAWRCAAR